MEIDWTNVTSVRSALTGGGTARELANGLDGDSAEVRATLSALSPAELATLAKLQAPLSKMLAAANAFFKVDKNFDAALRVHDSFLEVSASKLPRSAGVQAFMHVQDDEHHLGVQTERVQRYAKHYLPIALTNTPIYLNASFALIELGELDQAVEQLRLAILAGDPFVPKFLSNPAYAKVSNLPAFKSLASLEPHYPRALRQLQLRLAVYGDSVLTERAGEVDLDYVADDLSQGTGLYPQLEAVRFHVFAGLPDGGELAFWRRAPNEPLLTQAIVVFGSDGTISMYAADLTSFFCLFAHGWGLHAAEHLGFHFESKSWEPPSRKTLGKLKANKQVLTKLKSLDIPTGDLSADQARDAALALMPELLSFVQQSLGTPR